jgi:hypothetical protein
VSLNFKILIDYKHINLRQQRLLNKIIGPDNSDTRERLEGGGISTAEQSTPGTHRARASLKNVLPTHTHIRKRTTTMSAARGHHE